jgi:hypothetical protein
MRGRNVARVIGAITLYNIVFARTHTGNIAFPIVEVRLPSDRITKVAARTYKKQAI